MSGVLPTPSPDDYRRVVALACDQDVRSDEEQAALERVALYAEELCRREGVDVCLERLARCTREAVVR